MFSTLLGKQKARRSERTPLLAALHRYQSRESHRGQSASEDDHEDGTARYDGEDEDDEDGVSGRRDGPLLPVFSSEFLGIGGTRPFSYCANISTQIDYPPTLPPTPYVF